MTARRTLLTAAWSVPVIAVAAAAPQAAASTINDVPIIVATIPTDTRPRMWNIVYHDGTRELWANGRTMSHPIAGPMARKEGGK